MCYYRGKTTHTVSGSKNGRTSWRNISSMTDVLTSPIIMTGGMKPEYYIRKRILIFFNVWPISTFCKNDPYSVHSFLVVYVQNLHTFFSSFGQKMYGPKVLNILPFRFFYRICFGKFLIIPYELFHSFCSELNGQKWVCIVTITKW